MIGFNYLGKLGQLGNQMFQYGDCDGSGKEHWHSYCIPNHDEVFDDGIGNKLRIELFNALTLIQRELVLFLDQTFKRRTSPLTLLCLRSHLIMMHLLLVSSRHRIL